MTTYNSYAEAKIANPDLEILEARPDWDGSPEYVGAFIANKPDGNGGVPYIGKGAFQKSNPADHCMTVERFLADGHKFVEGDLILDEGSVYLVAGCKSQSNWYETESANMPDCDDNSRYILRAAALEEKPKRVKVEYVQEKSFKEVLKCAIDGESFYSIDGKGEFKFDASRLLFVNHNGADVDISHLTEHCFYRKVETETEIDERQEFVDAALNALDANGDGITETMVKILFDSGKFKLVNDK